MNDDTTHSGPHCPVCDETAWQSTALAGGTADQDCCAHCGWKIGDPVPLPLMPEPQPVENPILSAEVIALLRTIIPPQPSRLERLTFALLQHRENSRLSVSGLIETASEIETLLRDAESEFQKYGCIRKAI